MSSLFFIQKTAIIKCEMKKDIKKKPKIAIISLTSCEGCQFVLLDLGKKFFALLEKLEVVDFELIEDEPFLSKKIDVAFIEGNPITEDDVKLLKDIRKKARIVVALGNCAALGGIPEMKNYQNKEKTIRYIYKNLKGIANPDIKEVDNFVKIDFSIPGCPIDGQEFLKYIKLLIKGEIPQIEAKPVCSECIFLGKEECFLRKKEPCFGPIILAGCKAICTEYKFPCYGCRGLLKNINPKGFLETLEKMRSKEEIDDDLELFGLKDNIYGN